MKIFTKTLSLGLIVSLIIAVLITAVGLWILLQFPTDKEIRGCLVTKLYKVKLCAQDSSYVKLSRISQELQRAVIMTEDSAFYTHKGFDFQEMENSFKSNLEKGRFARGGSTITQQLAKNLFLTSEKTLQRKILEALVTMRIEKVLTKREILEKYLNVVQFGKDLYGIKAASQFYFNKAPSDLSVVEAAFFAFLLPSPENYAKSYFQGKMTPFARKRLNQIVERMFNYHQINEDQYFLAQSELGSFLTGESRPSDLNFDQIQEEEIDLELELEGQ